MGSEVFHTLKKELQAAGHNTGIGDEGGFAPNLNSARDALDFILKSIEKAGYEPGEDIYLALDCAATEYFKDGKYEMKGEGKSLSAEENVDYLAGLAGDYPIISIEDGCSEDDWDGWKLLTDTLGRQDPAGRRRSVRHQPEASGRGHRAGLRQLDAGQGQPDRHADRNAGRPSIWRTARGYTNVMSHRSGETEDSTIADLAVATNCGQIKTGSLSRSDRLAKYNQLIRIEEMLGETAEYAGRSILKA